MQPIPRDSRARNWVKRASVVIGSGIASKIRARADENKPHGGGVEEVLPGENGEPGDGHLI